MSVENETCTGQCGICDMSCERDWIKSSHSLLGTPITVGELKRLLNNYNNDVSFGFRNQPLQSLYEVKYNNEILVFFE